MKEARVKKVEAAGPQEYLVECPWCFHTAWRTAAYLAMKTHRCASCHELIRMPEKEEYK